jgi:glycerophosphoryl diester phosphodiesterase
MTKTRIIGHRGASGQELENTLPSFERAIAAGAPIIEFDVHTTLDGVFVICHDANLERVSDSNKRIKDLTAQELRVISLHNGSYIPHLTEVLDLLRKHHVAAIVEAKTIKEPEQFCQILDAYTDMQLTVASFNHGLLATIRNLRPQLRIYLAEAHRPVAVLQEARSFKAQGIDLHYMLINPLTYWLAQYWKLDIMLYTVNNPFMVSMLRFFYPKVFICTNYPDKFIHTHRKKSRK